MRIAYLGPMVVSDGGQHLPLGGPKQRLVLARLLLARGDVIGTDQLIDALWEATPPTTARNTVQTYVSHLRGALGRGFVEGSGGGYRLRLDGVEVDALRFEELAARGIELLANEPVVANDHLERARQLWRGRPFGDLGSFTALRGESARLTELYALVIDQGFEAQLQLGQAARALAELEASVEEDPLRERRWELLMLALYRCGRQADALLTFERARAVLAESVGADPGAGLRALHQRILAQDPSLLLAATSEPVRAEVADPDGTRLPSPSRLVTSTTLPFVGRKADLAQLRRLWERASGDGKSHLVVVHGEPGAGKTRLAIELSREVVAIGGLVLAGACDDGLALPYQPFAEMLEWQTRHAPSLPLGRYPGELTRLLPDLGERVSSLPPPIRSDPRVEEHRLYEATASWLRTVAEGRGLLVVVDDLQWATEATLRLLHHVARVSVGEPATELLIVAGYRDTDVDGDHPLHAVLASLSRLGDRMSSLCLRPLTPDDVRELVVAAVDVDPEASDELAERIYERTAGNPFFVGEVLRSEPGIGPDDHDVEVATSGAPEAVPAGVRQVVRDRVRRLPDRTVEVLRVVAVLGTDASIGMVAALVGDDVEQVIDALEDAWHARLVAETGPDRFALTHALVRDVLVDELSVTRRRHLHAAVVEALESERPDDVVALATHAIAAGPRAEDGSRARAIGYAIAAGERTAEQKAAKDAAYWYGHAVALLDGGSDRALDLRTRLALGEVQRVAGDRRYRETLLTVTDDALAADRLDLALDAALLNHRPGMASVVGAPDEERIGRLEQLNAALTADRPIDLEEPDEIDAWRARVAALLSMELTFDRHQQQRRVELADEALELAGRLDDPALQVWTATTARMPLTVPDQVDRLAATIPRMVEPADLTGDPALRCMARLAAHNALLTVGSFGEARRWIVEADLLAREEGAPFLQMATSFHALQFSAYEGRFGDAHSANARCFEIAQELGETDAIVWWSGIEALSSFLEGTLPHLADRIGEVADAYPALLALRAAQVAALAVGGRHDEALELIEHHRFREVDGVPTDWLSYAAYAKLAITAFELADAELAANIVEILHPYEHHWAHIQLFCLAPNELVLGLALVAAGELDAGLARLCGGRDRLRSHGLRSHEAWASWYLARALVERDGPDDRAAARDAIADGAAAAHRYDLPALADQLAAV